jgi:hypothetical protein
MDIKTGYLIMVLFSSADVLKFVVASEISWQQSFLVYPSSSQRTRASRLNL